MSSVSRGLAALGAAVLNALGHLGALVLFAASGLSHIFRPPF